MLDPDVLAYGCPLDNGRHGSKQGLYASRSIGKLDILPREVLDRILSIFLDLPTLTFLRSVSRTFRLFIDEMSEYKTILAHAPSNIRAALSLEVASAYSCKDLRTVLHKAECSHCGKFGAFLHLLTCERLCYQCFTHDSYIPTTPDHPKIIYGITFEQIREAKLPFARSIPGFYQGNRIFQLSRKTLVDFFGAAMVAALAHRPNAAA